MAREAPFFITLAAHLPAHIDMDEIKMIRRGSYPITLENMKGPPARLYYRGRFPAPDDSDPDEPGRKYLCIVGSRKWSTYGRDAVYKIVSGLRGYPISIVSGLAIGIDSIAHMAGLEAGLHCIAFPGSTLAWDQIYPSMHTILAKRIVEQGGAVVSQWEVGYPTNKWAFPARNLVMAGLSHATLVVEAAYRSGSLMTAQHAEKCHRDVYAVPGPINADNSYGPHMLIRGGAALIRSAEDVLMELGFDISDTEAAERKAKLIEDRKDSLDELSKRIYTLLAREETPLEELLDMMAVKPEVLSEKLSYLELEGLIKTEDGMAKTI